MSDVARLLAGRFSFGIYDADDLEQDIYLWAYDALEKYEPARARLFNFVYTVARRKLVNLRRDKLERPSPPCYDCPINAYCAESGLCSAYAADDLESCTYYAQWRRRNIAKRSLMESPHISEVVVNSCPLNSMVVREQVVELSGRIAEGAPELLPIFLRLWAGDKVSYIHRERLALWLKSKPED